MEDMKERNDEIGKLIREEGLMHPSPGFTDRVMLLVEENRQKANVSYKPLINRKTWIILGLIFAFLTVASFYKMPQNQPEYLNKIKSATDFLSGIHFPVHIDSSALMLATLIFVTVGLMLVVDFLINKKLREIYK